MKGCSFQRWHECCQLLKSTKYLRNRVVKEQEEFISSKGKTDGGTNSQLLSLLFRNKRNSQKKARKLSGDGQNCWIHCPCQSLKMWNDTTLLNTWTHFWLSRLSLALSTLYETDWTNVRQTFGLWLVSDWCSVLADTQSPGIIIGIRREQVVVEHLYLVGRCLWWISAGWLGSKGGEGWEVLVIVSRHVWRGAELTAGGVLLLLWCPAVPHGERGKRSCCSDDFSELQTVSTWICRIDRRLKALEVRDMSAVIHCDLFK